MILNKIKYKLQYFGDMSNLHGVRHVVSRSHIPTVKRLFWSVILVACSLGAGAILKSSLSLFSAGATSYSVMTDYLHWDTPFPAVTVCEETDDSRIKAYLQKNQLPVTLLQFYKDIGFLSVRYCRSCNNCVVNVTCIEDFIEIAKKIRRKCTSLLKDCWWGGQYFRCCNKFQPIQTEYGTCYVFNSAVVGNTTILSVNRRVGLPQLEFSAINHVMIRVHSPEDVVSVAMENVLRSSSLPFISNYDAVLRICKKTPTTLKLPAELRYFKLKGVEQTVNDVSVNCISPSIRGCLFNNENPHLENWPFEGYSFSECLLYCRGLAQYTHCNCTHHFLASIVNIPACDLKGLACLYQNRDNFLNFHCDCPMSCDEILYKEVHSFFNRTMGKPPPELLSKGSRATIRLTQLPTLRVRRFAIRDNLGLVVDIGGIGGVFFGASLLSIMELIYLFCIRNE